MRSFFLLFFIFFLNSCNKPKTVFICGDHICINKAEAKQYFEENLSLEVKVIDRKDKKPIKLVELNLNKENGKKEIFITKKNDPIKDLKTLSKKEIKIKKEQLKNKKNQKTNENEIKVAKKIIIQNRTESKTKYNVVDICTIIDKCNIEEISKYLIKKGKQKDFPNITRRQ